LDTLLEFNSFKFGLSIAEQLFIRLKFYLNQNHNIENRKKIFTLFDSLLLGLFDILEDQKKLSVVIYNENYDVMKERGRIMQVIREAMDLL